MSNDSNSKATGGVGFLGLLTIAFIVLKLCKVIHWSWIWVFSPIWIPMVIFILVFMAIILFANK